jgi:hypothetical protein
VVKNWKWNEEKNDIDQNQNRIYIFFNCNVQAKALADDNFSIHPMPSNLHRQHEMKTTEETEEIKQNQA